ncbi:MAG: DUF2269 family protein [Jatrophihabitans sp.]|uniref:DUF2269 family protein n=1 Tax=Jatrophihabitans sp. TaxID=1932789 RepID=UPI003F8065D2
MKDLLLALHLLFAIFAVGPLVHAATTAGRGVRKGDGGATAAASRMLRIYSYASVLVIIAGFGLMSQKEDGQMLGKFTQPWIWVSLLLWLVAVGVVLLVMVPSLDKVTAAIGREESVVSMTGRIAASGGVVGLAFVVIVVLMAYKPGH